MYRLVCFFGLYPWIDALKLLLISIIHEHIWASKENIPWWNVSKSWWMNWYFSCITGEAKKKSSFISSAASRPIPRLMPPLLTLPHPYYSLIFNLLEKLDQCLGLVCYGWFRHVSNKAAATIRYSPELGRVSNLLLLWEKIREKGMWFLLLLYDALLLLFSVYCINCLSCELPIRFRLGWFR